MSRVYSYYDEDLKLVPETLEKSYRKNAVILGFQMTVTTTILLYTSGAFLQSFLLSFGVSAAKVGFVTSAYSLTQIISMVFCAFVSDKIKNIKRVFSFCALPQIFFYIAMALLCIVKKPDADIVFLVTIITLFILGIFLGVMNILVYKLPYLVMNMNNYGRFLSITGIVVGVFGVIVSAAGKFFIKNFDYYTVMLISFLICAALVVAEYIFCSKLKTVNNPENPKKERISFLEVFKHKSFLILAIPNLFRGISIGISGMIPVFAMKDFNANADMTASLSVILNVASILSSVALMFILSKFKGNTLCFWSSLLFCVPLFAMAFTKSWEWYLVLYFVFYFWLNVFGSAVPIYVAQIVPYEMMGGYTSLRMGLTTGGTALGSMISGALVSTVSASGMLITAAVLQLVSGAVYGLYPYIQGRMEEIKIQ